MVHMHISENMGDGEGVRNIGIATLAQLAFVTLFSKRVGALYTSGLLSASR